MVEEDEEPRWKKLLDANRKKAKVERGGRTKQGAGKMTTSRSRANRCDMCSRSMRRGGHAEQHGLVYCHQCATDRGLL